MRNQSTGPGQRALPSDLVSLRLVRIERPKQTVQAGFDAASHQRQLAQVAAVDALGVGDRPRVVVAPEPEQEHDGEPHDGARRRGWETATDRRAPAISRPLGRHGCGRGRHDYGEPSLVAVPRGDHIANFPDSTRQQPDADIDVGTGRRDGQLLVSMTTTEVLIRFRPVVLDRLRSMLLEGRDRLRRSPLARERSGHSSLAPLRFATSPSDRRGRHPAPPPPGRPGARSPRSGRHAAAHPLRRPAPPIRRRAQTPRPHGPALHLHSCASAPGSRPAPGARPRAARHPAGCPGPDRTRRWATPGRTRPRPR